MTVPPDDKFFEVERFKDFFQLLTVSDICGQYLYPVLNVLHILVVCNRPGKTEHFFVLLKQPIGQMRASKAVDSGDQIFHDAQGNYLEL